MAKPMISRRWAYRGLFVAIALLLIVLRMLPLSTKPEHVPGPDLLICFTFAWVLRRPDYVPVLLIALVFLFEDLILMRPPGLWAVIVVAGSEFLRGREALTRELGFAMEWAMASVVMVAMLLAYRMAFMVAFLDQPAFGLAALQIAASILCYPLVVLFSRSALNLHKAAPGEVDALGRRM